jgi:lysophospholipase L1-like esterase
MNETIKVYLAGDSTVQTYSVEHAPQAGWGQFIHNYFSDNVIINNHAIGGRSSKTFVTEGRLEAIGSEIGQGDYLFIQMGHNDSTVSKPERYTDPDTDYKAYLHMYVDSARKREATPVFITPVGRLHYEQGSFMNDFPAYCKAMKEVAAEAEVLLIDLMQKSLQQFTAVGYEEAKSFFMISSNGTDCTHFTEKGANRMAALVAQGVKELGIPVSAYVRPN